MADTRYYGTGRRKKSVARVYLIPGTGKITINKRDIDDYLGLETLKVIVRQPLELTETVDKYDVIAQVASELDNTYIPFRDAVIDELKSWGTIDKRWAEMPKVLIAQ